MATPRSALSSPYVSSFVASCVYCLLLFAGRARAQPKTDPSEVKALNSLFDGWKISSGMSTIRWNTTGDPCSGAAVVNNTTLDDVTFNPGIKCNCSFNNMSTCHITELKAVDQSDTIQGNIPEDIQNLTMLTNLNLHGNQLSGPLPVFIGTMTNLEHLDLGSNTLSGIIPKEIRSLKNLITLDLGINSFSGSLPEELGKLLNLRELRLHSLNSQGLGINGVLPTTLGQLRKLQIMWISDNNFTGRIPDTIGSLTELTDLRLQGNFLEGPIPSSFSNLNNLTQLYIGELSSGSPDLIFLENSKSLSTLILRNCKISGNISSFIGNFTKLEHLDLSFNNLTGQLPQSLFTLPSLEYLFLGNNSLSGDLPSRKSDTLLNIDLSYNDLSGSFPYWVKDAKLKLNLVANNLFIDTSNYSDIPSGLSLRCLQKNFPCNRSSPFHSSFAINCGGNAVSEYEADNAPLTTASYYLSNDSMWGVSSVGRFMELTNATYTRSIDSLFSNIQTNELFQKARLSPSSLRYYGLGLVNGNYTVTLMFGETDGWNRKKRRRLFDIYMQGILVVKDFDIIDRAAGRTLYGVVYNSTVLVTENFLEIHLFWAGKGTCCIPNNGSYGPSISAISVTLDSQPPQGSQPVSSLTKKMKILIAGLAAVAFFLILIFGIFVRRLKKRPPGADDDDELLGLTNRPNTFSYAELRTATEDFNPTNKLGMGGFGAVYKGVLSDGKLVAVKQLSVSSVQGKRQFVTEVATISAVQHRNLVRLYGCCCEGNKRLLVYEYLVNRSVDQVLFGKHLHLDWPARFRICLGTARGLAYIHEESRPPIIHRDIKASNILLDSNLNPKISDFGLAKLYDYKMSHISTGVAGTIGYLAPEYAMRGQLTEKADVFGFGVVMLEIVCGRQNTEPGLGAEKMYLLEWAWHLHEEKRDFEMIDPTLEKYNKEEALRAIGVAFMCIQSSAARRPAMSRVVAMLVGDMRVTEVLTRPSHLMDWRYSEVSGNFSAARTYQSTLASMPSDVVLDEGR